VKRENCAIRAKDDLPPDFKYEEKGKVALPVFSSLSDKDVSIYVKIRNL
jgi:hypothetical protein